MKSAKFLLLAGIAVLALSFPVSNWIRYSGSLPWLSSAGQVEATTQPTFHITPKPWPLHRRSTLLNVSSVNATSLILVDEDTGTILAARDDTSHRAMASITKIMTASIVLEFADPNSTITIPKSAFDGLPPDSAVMGISVGEKYTVEELLYGMLLPSGNDAAQALAIGTAGSQSQFVALMNGKAAQLGLKDTHFTNPSGLDDPKHYTSAQDLAVIAHYARSFPLFTQIVATPEKYLPYSPDHKAIDLTNFNSLINMYPGATGMKPGDTGDAGDCLVASAERNGHHLIGVLLNTNGRNTNMEKLLDIGFAALGQ